MNDKPGILETSDIAFVPVAGMDYGTDALVDEIEPATPETRVGQRGGPDPKLRKENQRKRRRRKNKRGW